MFYNIPVIGEWLVVLIQGGREIGSLTLTRIYGLHAIVVPLIIFGLVGYHIYLVVHHGTTSPSERKEEVHSAEEQRELYQRDAESTDRGETFYPETMGRSGLMAFAFVALAVILTKHGRQVAVDIAAIERRMSKSELAAYIRQPPAEIAMPAYADLPESDVERLADYVLAAQTFPREF